jgi:hypothetical protein
MGLARNCEIAELGPVILAAERDVHRERHARAL